MQTSDDPLAGSRPPGPSGARPAPRVLVVDDIAVNTELVQIVLERGGYGVVVASGGPAAIEAAAIVAAAGERFDLVLLDLQMPGMDGFATLRALRRSGFEGAAEVPVVALTALGTAAIVERCREEGMSGHLLKPITPDRLIALVAARVGRPGRDGTTGGEARAISALVATPDQSPDPLGSDQSASDRLASDRRESALDRLQARFAADLADCEAALDGLSTQAATEGWTGARRLAASNLCHRLAGSSGMFGEPGLTQAARVAEQASLTRDADLDAPLRALRAALRAALA